MGKIFSIINIILIVLYSVVGYFVIPQFEELFKGFGAELPVATKFVLISYHYWSVLVFVPLIILVKYLMTPELTARSNRILTYITMPMFVFLVFFIPLLVVVLYLPIFLMGSKM